MTHPRAIPASPATDALGILSEVPDRLERIRAVLDSQDAGELNWLEVATLQALQEALQRKEPSVQLLERADGVLDVIRLNHQSYAANVAVP